MHLLHNLNVFTNYVVFYSAVIVENLTHRYANMAHNNDFWMFKFHLLSHVANGLITEHLS